MSTKYTLENGAILRDGVKIATRDPASGTIDYLPDMDRYRAPVSGWLKEAGLDKPPVTPPEVAARQAQVRVAGADPKAEALPAGEVAQPPPEVAAPPVIPPAAATAPAAPVAPTAEQARIAQLEAELAALRAKPAPIATPAAPVLAAAGPTVQNANAIDTARAAGEQAVLSQYHAQGAPKLDPNTGDKTPEFVRWLCRHHPDAARVRYNNRRVMGGKLIEEIIAEQASN